MESLREKRAFICDMDGVIYHGNQLLEGVKPFVEWTKKNLKALMFLTNSSERVPKELQQKLSRMGIELDERQFHTSALATASFLQSQTPGGSAYVIGEPGLVSALYDAGFTMNDVNPDYVVVGETRNYHYENIVKAVHLVNGGAKLIGCNPDLTGPSETGIVPATRAFIAPIELATGKAAYFIGKPNPLMMRHALKRLGCDPSEAVIVGDRMDTDILAGIEADVDTVLVLSGVSTRETLSQFPYCPKYVLNGIGDIVNGDIANG